MSSIKETEVCSVCGDASTPPTSTCPTCHQRCHTRCSNRRKGAQCDNCRTKKEPRAIKPPASTTPASKQVRRSYSSTSAPRRPPIQPKNPQVRARMGPKSPSFTTPSSHHVSPLQRIAHVVPTPLTKNLPTVNVTDKKSKAISKNNTEDDKSTEDNVKTNTPDKTLDKSLDNTENSKVSDKRVPLTSTPNVNLPQTSLESKSLLEQSTATTTLNYCKMPSTMLDLFGKQFELLTRSMDDHYFGLSKKLEAISNAPASSVAPDGIKQLLETRLLLLENKIDTQSAKLEGLQNDRLLLLQENRTLKEQLNKLMTDISVMINDAKYSNCKKSSTHLRNLDREGEANGPHVMVSLRDDDVLPPNPSEMLAPQVRTLESGYQVQARRRRMRMSRKATTLNTELAVNTSDAKRETFSYPGRSGAEAHEIIFTGIVDSTRAKLDPVDVAFLVLGTVLPTLNRSDILNARQAAPTSKQGKKASPGGEVISIIDRPAPFVVRLVSAAKVEEVMRAKASYTRFGTSDIDLSGMSERFAKSLCPTKIFINEALTDIDYSTFKTCKSVARNLGFRFVWHRRGKFLVRMREGLRSHIVKSSDELYRIADL